MGPEVRTSLRAAVSAPALSPRAALCSPLSAGRSSLQRVENDTGLLDDGFRVERRRLKCGDDSLSLGEVAVRNEPTRRLRQELDHDKKTDSEDALKCDGYAPRGRGRDEGEAIVDPAPSKARRVSAGCAAGTARVLETPELQSLQCYAERGKAASANSPVGDGGSSRNHSGLDTYE